MLVILAGTTTAVLGCGPADSIAMGTGHYEPADLESDKMRRMIAPSQYCHATGT